ncbi:MULTISPECIES: AAA family ATPase [unclassified Microbacterium]|uniref:AAA family ATPase n=1 Tax=unclassified Microbacterium TaxID=2609290 RepID=UPI0036613318
MTGRDPSMLIGREHELRLLRGFVEAAAAGGAALVVIGEAGIGKTALAEATADDAAARGMRVLRAAGVEFEAEVSFASLHQLLAPLVAEFATLPPPYRRALAIALGMENGPTDRLVLVNAVSDLLAAASTGGVLVVVDDLQWLDPASATVLAALARRVKGTAIGLLGVVRAGETSAFDDAGLDELAVPPLDEAAAGTLLAEAFPELASRLTREVIAEAQGNPLALIELPRETGNGSAEPSAGRTPVGRRLRQHFARRIRSLPDASRAQLLQAALDGIGDLFPATAAADLAPAERARLISVNPVTHSVRFRHPLTRSAVVELSTEQERRHAHGALADRHSPGSERHAWHLAAAAAAPDESIAQLLEDVALRTKSRGDPVGAIRLLLRAAELSPATAEHHRRAMFATYLGADVTGDLAPARLSAVAVEGGRSHTVATAVAAAAYMVNSGGDVDTIHRLLLGALRSVPVPVREWDAPLAEIVYVLQANCSFGSRADLIADYRTALDRLGLAPPEGLRLLGDTFLEPATRALPALTALDAAIHTIDQEFDHALAVRMGIAAMYVDRIDGCRTALWRVVNHGRAGGAIASAIKAFVLLGFDGVLSGDWDGTLRLADEGLEYTDRHRYRLLGGFLQYDRAMIAAARGDTLTAHVLANELVGWADQNRIGFVQQLVAHVRTTAALSTGDFGSAYRHALQVCAPETVPAFAPAALWMLFDLVEAAVRAGQPEEAARHVADIRAADVAGISPRLALVTAAAEAMISPHDRAPEAFAAALAIPGVERWPFLLARIRLAYGERMRRAKENGEARRQLSQAAEAFERLGAAPWLARARSELRAMGVAAGPAPEATADLTPQEQEIARLAAAGLTNRQIGERLYLSPRTVGSHLYHLFPKLGVASRAGLSDALRERSS